MLRCNQTDCRFNDAAKLLCQMEVYLVDRRCITFKRRPKGENYREIMRVGRSKGTLILLL
ncbi:hypothetical protein SPACI_006710 [Sporomusa acidovorans DSM 3132]|uniref:Uncharacterized protein n=1 Tax=Sporomusa acidovorans (strain ATCC 49682 / DSM 3132 / Mol) TaxID=1123286 RepID=A0ABZ3IX72_SPOA4|nr:hypothetical protein SPACI_00910 [Sporomusa acidovorans DSM 3132]SDF85267.1 hypothetical protein SAMN04488499_11024 [Sporomusa acidovorans]